MKYIRWLIRNRFEMVMALVAAAAVIVGFIASAVLCDDLDDQHRAAVTAGVFDVKAAPAEVDKAEQTVYYNVSLSSVAQDHIFAECARYDIDPAVVVAICYRESDYDASAVGDNCRSYGLMQIQKACHIERMARLGVTDLLDPCQNITVGVDYLAEKLRQYGDMDMALTAYNLGHYSGEITQYAKNVLATANALKLGGNNYE